MAEEKEIILSVDTGQAESRLAQVQRQITELTKAQKELKKQYDAGKVGAEDYAVANATFAKGLQALKGEYKTLTEEATKNISVNASLGSSYNEISARLSQAQKQYKALSKAQRESAEGEELLTLIQEQKDALKEMDATMGDFQRNVGNYPQAMAGAFGPLDGILKNVGTSVEDLANNGMGALQGGIAKTGKALINFGKALVTTPIGLVIAAIAALVAVLDSVSEAFDRSDDAGTKWNRGMAAVDAQTKKGREQMDSLANAIGGVMDKFSEWVASFDEDTKKMRALVTAIDELEEAERNLSVESAKNQQEVSELRAKVAEKDKYTADERKAYLEEAINLEKKDLEAQKKLAEERLRVEIETNKQNVDTSDEAKDRETKLKVELIQLETNFNNKMREFAAQRVEINNQIAADAKAKADEEKRLEEERLARQREWMEERKRIKELEVELTNTLEDELISLLADGADKERAQAKLNYERELKELQEKYGKEYNLSKEAKEQLLLLEDAIEKKYMARLEEINSEETTRQIQLARAKAEAVAKVEDEAYNNRLARGEVQFEERKRRNEERAREEVEALAEGWRKAGLTEEEIKLNSEKLLNEKLTAQKIQDKIAQDEAIAQAEDEIYNQRKEAGLVKEEEQKAVEEEKFAQELETMRMRLEEKGVAEEEIQRLINEKKTAQAEAQAQKEEEIEKQKSIAVANQMSDSLNAFGSVLDGVEKLAGAFAKDDEERAKMSKVLALGKIAIQTGIAIASGVAAAAAAGPPPANLIAIATTITTVMGNIAAAISAVNGAKFATGGIVGGTSYTGDNVPVMVNSGEMILNQGQQARLFELANGYGASNMEALAGAMAYAVSQQPAPVVVYDEFNAFGAKVAQINEMTTFNL